MTLAHCRSVCLPIEFEAPNSQPTRVSAAVCLRAPVCFWFAFWSTSTSTLTPSNGHENALALAVRFNMNHHCNLRCMRHLCKPDPWPGLRTTRSQPSRAKPSPTKLFDMPSLSSPKLPRLANTQNRISVTDMRARFRVLQRNPSNAVAVLPGALWRICVCVCVRSRCRLHQSLSSNQRLTQILVSRLVSLKATLISLQQVPVRVARVPVSPTRSTIRIKPKRAA